jgi:hypothetical protein
MQKSKLKIKEYLMALFINGLSEFHLKNDVSGGVKQISFCLK